MACSLTASDLPPDLARFVEAEIAAGRFASVEDVLRAGKEALERQRHRRDGPRLAAGDATHDEGECRSVVEGGPCARVRAEPVTSPPFWVTFLEEFAALPDEVFERLPKDGAREHALSGRSLAPIVAESPLKGT